jgi:hypothetical protein
MLEREILYYPTILVPSRWQRRTILYWDKISSIVPGKWDDELGPNSFRGNQQAEQSYRDMKYLESKGEFEAIRPENRPVPIDTEFKQIINSSELDKKVDHNWKDFSMSKQMDKFKLERIFNKDLRESFSFVHKDKMTNHLYDFLFEKNLVLDENIDENWFLMEKHTSLLYMALLAKYLAEFEAEFNDKFVVTGTNSEEYLSMIFKRDIKQEGFNSYETRLLNMLPVPRDDVPIEKIYNFKHEREPELFSFREVIDEATKQISHAENQREMNKILIQQNEKLKVGMMKLKKAMSDSNIKATLTSIKSLIDIKDPSILTTLGIVVGAAAHIPILAAVGALGVGITWIDARNEQIAACPAAMKRK